MESSEQHSVLIAGGGVAGLEAVLAMREIERAPLSITLLSPTDEFVLAPLSVLEPFGSDEAPRVPLAEFCAEQGVELAPAGLAEVWPEAQRVLTDTGDELPYDSLLLCIGARRRSVLEGALDFRGGADTAAIEELIKRARGLEGGRLAFVVPVGTTWPLPLYELALLVADQLDEDPVEIAMITHEESPLEAFGPSASSKVAELLEAARIELTTSERESTAPGGRVAADWVVTVPELDVPELPGLPQVANGFIAVDPQMRVIGAEHVWAVGDVTWSPLKQGGLAAQQADVAAASIAAAAGVDLEVPAYAPVLRAALMTRDGPYYMRSGSSGEDGEQRAPLWWPPAKVAGRLLAPYLASRDDDIEVSEPVMLDLDADESREAEHLEALELALLWADLDAKQGDLRRALHWLEVAEGLDLVVPEDYRRKREQWRRELAD